jgi:hypothetical protein
MATAGKAFTALVPTEDIERNAANQLPTGSSAAQLMLGDTITAWLQCQAPDFFAPATNGATMINTSTSVSVDHHDRSHRAITPIPIIVIVIDLPMRPAATENTAKACRVFLPDIANVTSDQHIVVARIGDTRRTTPAHSTQMSSTSTSLALRAGMQDIHFVVDAIAIHLTRHIPADQLLRHEGAPD